jgi:hypothetical protein
LRPSEKINKNGQGKERKEREHGRDWRRGKK